jgi:hypothetical protein
MKRPRPPWRDPEIEALKIEIKKRETDVSTASDEVVVVEKLIHDFGIRHNRELGEIVSPDNIGAKRTKAKKRNGNMRRPPGILKVTASNMKKQKRRNSLR